MAGVEDYSRRETRVCCKEGGQFEQGQADQTPEQVESQVATRFHGKNAIVIRVRIGITMMLFR